MPLVLCEIRETNLWSDFVWLYVGVALVYQSQPAATATAYCTVRNYKRM